MAFSKSDFNFLCLCFIAFVVNFSRGFAPREVHECPRSTDVVFGWYHVCSRNLFARFNHMGEGQVVSGDMFIDAYDSYCHHQCEVFDCLKDRYNVEECSQKWQDEFYEGVNLAESVCGGQRLRPSIRQFLGGLRLDTNDTRWSQCSRGAFPSIYPCNNQLKNELSRSYGVENFFLTLSEMDFSLAPGHMRQYMTSLTQCVYDSSVQSGCDPSWAKLTAVVALDLHNSPFNYGVNTSDILLNIGQDITRDK